MLTVESWAERLASADFMPAYGQVTSIASHLIEADGPAGTIGQLCRLVNSRHAELLAEIVAVERGRVLLSPLGSIDGVLLGDRVMLASTKRGVAVGDAFAGRAVDALGLPIDDRPRIAGDSHWPLHGDLPSPLDREEPNKLLETGIRAIDGLLTLGRGQRVGVFAASGVGKTSLIEQIVQQSDVDRIVLCLVGERGREVEAMWRAVRECKNPKRFAMVASTSDESAPRRARAPLQALALAEYWRSRGEHVLLVIDSVTRFAMALREVGLAAGGPPTVRGYTPNVFAALPELVERCGALKSGGAISAIMTVLSETDDVDDPIVEVMKSLLDGHIVLSRSIAEQGQFPAVDVIRSVSRGLQKRTSTSHRSAITEAVRLLSAWNEARVMIETGAYRAGASPLVDRAITQRDALREFLTQGQDDRSPFGDAVTGLKSAVGQVRHDA